MPHYKNSNNELFWLEDDEDPLVWLEDDCVLITEEETAAIRASQVVEVPAPATPTVEQLMQVVAQLQADLAALKGA